MTGHADVTGNALLAARALALADAAGAGSIERKAALCAYIAFCDTRSVPAARKVLDGLGHIAPHILDAARGVLDQVGEQS